MTQSPYTYRAVEIAREEWETPQEIDTGCLDPMMNVVDLWWRPAAPYAWRVPTDRHGHWQRPAPPTLATLEERLRTLDTAVELMQRQLDEMLALLKGKSDG